MVLLKGSNHRRLLSIGCSVPPTPLVLLINVRDSILKAFHSFRASSYVGRFNFFHFSKIVQNNFIPAPRAQNAAVVIFEKFWPFQIWRKKTIMPVLCFVLDTSASMNRRTAQGQRVIDLAKTAIDNFLKKVENLSKISNTRIWRPRSQIFLSIE